MKSALQVMRRISSWTGLSALCAMGVSCELEPLESQVATLGRARPQAITYLDDQTLAVSDISYRAGRWGEGRIIFLNPLSGARSGVWYTPVVNPQRLRVSGDDLMVVSSGEIDLRGAPQGGQSALSVLSTRSPLRSTQSVIWEARPRGSFLVDVIRKAPQGDTGDDDRPSYELSSGLDGILWRVALPDPTSSSGLASLETTLRAARYAPSDSLTLGMLRRWRDYTLIVDFNADQLSFLDREGYPASCAPELGQFEGVMEGAQTPYVDGDTLWVSFGLSGRLIELDLAGLDLADPACETAPLEYDPPLGQVPNDLLVTSTLVYVLHTAESAIWVYDRASRERVSVWPLPEQTSPWGFALSPDQETLAISEWARGGVTLMDARDGSLQREIPEEVLAPSPPQLCQWSDQWSDQRGQRESGWEVSAEGVVFSWSSSTAQRIEEGRREAQPVELQGAPQLAFVLAPGSGAVEVEVQLSLNGPWRPISGVGVVREEVSPPLGVGEVRERAVTLGVSPASEERAPLADSRLSELSDPCAPFTPQHPELDSLDDAMIIRLPLTSALDAQESSSTLWGGAHPKAGRVAVSQVRIRRADPARSARIWAISYRSW